MQQVRCQEECMHKAKCYPCNNPSVMTHEEYMLHANCQVEYMKQPTVTRVITQVS